MSRAPFWRAPSLRALCALTAVAFVALPSRTDAQIATEVSNCVTGVPAFGATDPVLARAVLDRLLWRSAESAHKALLAQRGALVAFDAIVARGDTLIRLARGDAASALDAVITLVRTRQAAARASLAAALTADSVGLAEGKVVDAASLRLGAGGNPGTVILGVDTIFTITEANRAVAVAVCAVAGTTTRLLEYLDQPALRAVARDYAAAQHHWELFVRQGYSMTMWERLAASCRLRVVGWLINPVRRCDTSPGRSLEPPRQQWIFLHPVGGLMPVFRNDSTYSELAVVEWYGYLRHSYGPSDLTTYGLAFASAVPRAGRPMPGAVLHTPWGSAGVFADRNNRAQYTLTADALGWIGALREQMRRVQRTPLEHAMRGLKFP